MALTLHTNKGDIKLELACEEVPRLCFNFLALAASGYYDGLTLHRSIPGFIIQGGDPTVGATKVGQAYEYTTFTDRGPKGGESIWGGKFEDSFHPNLRHNRRGVLSMANKNAPNTNGSQFFITYSAQDHLDDNSSAFGIVKAGLEVLDTLEAIPVGKKNRPVEPVVIERITIHANPLAT
mmetsp:Transcript_2164/g.4987  ORF Transcript_2164/g.4987 Transcript_2164/m.4987 type:complete len:179 (-) Transcript_2164:336-872(-)|eukprot:CAMPEP_0171492130 /NCGR_PEP_ID=MMETSP0958-20121227/4244_1 /TAXON_ID=87120 /ORGANISM="Aurantiochytrium limacinum, Strain ATCCMYA-1381" /LENGTH=178 /DNA_ID=CAMNT_0012025625 /DNA_START=82 /DNA_END=618 /DNA_ORIENTATION=+